MDKDTTEQQTETTKKANNTAMSSQQQTVDTATAVQPKKRRFQVEIYDKITYGEPPMEQVKYEKVHYDNPVIIEASSKKDLQDFAEKLSLCKQTFKIVKVLDDAPEQQIEENNKPTSSNNVQKNTV